ALLVQDSRDQPVDMAEGSGLHLDASIAFTRAVCEAAQSRLSTIHGGRDDLTSFYDRLRAQGAARNVRQPLVHREAFARSRGLRWAELPSLPVQGQGIEALLALLLQRLARQGFNKVLRHRFDLPLEGLQVVKIIVPGCQEAAAPLERAGRRLLARAGHQD
ncbi:MAG: hypothetical protein CFE45_42555, partial [Burkholderiales bacterium PBB5]